MAIKITLTQKTLSIKPPNNTTITITPPQTKTLTINTSPVMVKGSDGLSAYDLAIKNNLISPEVTEMEWLESLKGRVFWSSTNW